MLKLYPKTSMLYAILVLISSWYIGTLGANPLQSSIISGIVAIIIGIPFYFYWIKKVKSQKP